MRSRSFALSACLCLPYVCVIRWKKPSGDVPDRNSVCTVLLPRRAFWMFGSHPQQVSLQRSGASSAGGRDKDWAARAVQGLFGATYTTDGGRRIPADGRSMHAGPDRYHRLGPPSLVRSGIQSGSGQPKISGPLCIYSAQLCCWTAATVGVPMIKAVMAPNAEMVLAGRHRTWSTGCRLSVLRTRNWVTGYELEEAGHAMVLVQYWIGSPKGRMARDGGSLIWKDVRRSKYIDVGGFAGKTERRCRRRGWRSRGLYVAASQHSQPSPLLHTPTASQAAVQQQVDDGKKGRDGTCARVASDYCEAADRATMIWPWDPSRPS